MQRQFFNSNRERSGNGIGGLGTILAAAALLMLSACDNDSSRATVTDNNLSEPGKDGVPPTLTSVTMQPNGVVEAGQTVRIDFTASEALATPVVYINNVPAEVDGRIADWVATREMTDTDPEGEVTFSITYQDISGELGQAVTSTTNDSSACIGPECPGAEEPQGPLEGNWQLDFAGVGPAPGDTSWFSIEDTGPDGPRACWFDDIYQFDGDGAFRNIQGEETYLEPWQGVAEGCGPPVPPHDGSNNAVFEYDEDAGTLQLIGRGAYLGLAKVVNGAELTTPADTPESVTYEVVELVGDSLTVRIDAGAGGVWWEFRLSRVSNAPVVGNWKLTFAGVGPTEGDTSWFSIADTGPDGPRACWFDDIYHFSGDTSFQNFQGAETYLEPWQGVAEEGCGAPIAPHDGSTVGNWIYDEDAGTVTLDGLGLYMGLAKVVNGGELADPANAPESVTYSIALLAGDSMTLRIDAGNADVWWEFRFERVATAPELEGNWQLDFAGVGPTPGDTSWFSIEDTGPDGPRACWFDDIYQFDGDGAFRNIQGEETYLEPWQGVAEGCGPPIPPHDGSNNAVFEYDEDAATLQLTGLGAYLGLAKVVNDAELATPADTPASVTYEVVELVGDSLTVRIDAGGGGVWWEFRLSRVSNSPVVGNWKLNFAGVGPSEGDTSWFSIEDTGPDGPRACWFNDIYHFSGDTSFQNFQGEETYLEPWQGVAEGCGTPVAPHDGSTVGDWIYDEDAGTLTLDGLGLYLGIAKVINGGELADPANAPESVTYSVVELVGGTMTVRIDAGNGDVWWEFVLAKEE